MKLTDLIANYAKAQLAGAVLPCPRCGGDMRAQATHNCLSRRADIYVCEKCGAYEALEDMRYREDNGKKLQLNQWFIATSLLGLPNIKEEDEEILLEARVKFTVTPQIIDDIVCTALEGGICYWCSCAEVVEEEDVEGEIQKKYLGEYASDQISRGGSLRLYDIETNKTFLLTKENLLKGIILAVQKGLATDWLKDGEVDEWYIDAIVADQIIQLAIFDEIVYG